MNKHLLMKTIIQNTQGNPAESNQIGIVKMAHTGIEK